MAYKMTSTVNFAAFKIGNNYFKLRGSTDEEIDPRDDTYFMYGHNLRRPIQWTAQKVAQKAHELGVEVSFFDQLIHEGLRSS